MQNEQMTITRPEVARALTDLKTTQLLEPFMKRELSLSEAARELELTLPSLLYHVNRFTKFGLLEVACVERRKGRPIKRYRASAKTFFVPYDLTPSETLAHLLQNLMAPGERRFHREAANTLQARSPNWGLNISCPTGEGIDYALASQATDFVPDMVDSVLKADVPALFISDGTLELDFATAKALQKELVDLFNRYRQKQQPGSQHYAYRLGLTPMQDESFGDA